MAVKLGVLLIMLGLTGLNNMTVFIIVIVAFLENATIGYSLESVCVCVCPCVYVCVFAR